MQLLEDVHRRPQDRLLRRQHYYTLAELAELHSGRLGRCQRLLGALSDQPGLKLCD